MSALDDLAAGLGPVVAASVTPGAADVMAFLRSWDGSEPYALATVIHTEGATAAKAGARAVITTGGDVIGFVGGGCLRGALKKAAFEAIEVGEPRLIHVRPDGAESDPLPAAVAFANRCPSQGRVGVFIEPVAPRPYLAVFGEGALAHWVRELSAAVEIQAVISTDIDFESPTTAERLGAGIIVVATQGQGDKAALTKALLSGCPTVFFVASPKKAAHWREQLAGEGFGADVLSRLRAPAGLDLGARTPAEIAISIIAEIIKLRRRGPDPKRASGVDR
ncbi:MAG: XdhC family protein [Pseudomonadota bacterium]